MDYGAVIVVMAVVFGGCDLVDKGFTRVFRKQQQHLAGLAVRLNKRYGSFGLILAVLGLAAIFSGLTNGWILIAGGSIILVVGVALVVYYMTFGVFYDQESFLVTTFGKRSIVYRYGQITGQQLYNASGNLLIELYMDDGRTVQLQAGMTGVYPFLDKAFAKWLEQTGRRQEECDFHKPDQHCWFPPVGG